MKARWMMIWAALFCTHITAWADAPKMDLIPELKDIEKIAAEQEAAIRAQSEALQKAQQEKELAEKAAKEAIDKQTSPLTSATTAPANEANTKPERKVETPQPKTANKTVKKAPAEPIEKTNPWLAQERRYSFP